MPRIVDYCTAPVQKRRVSISDSMADDVREILGRNLTADDVAREFDNDQDIQEVVRELIAEDIPEERYPGWAMGLGITEQEWSEHYEQVDRAMRVKRKFAAKKAALSAEYAKSLEKLELQEKRMMPLWSPKSKLIREITEMVYKGLSVDEMQRLDEALNDLKSSVNALKVTTPPLSPKQQATGVEISQVEIAEG